jgi:hypothetical protein
MRINTKSVSIFGKIVLDGWEVLLGGAIACFVVGGAWRAEHFLIFVGIALLLLWVVMVFMVNLGYVKPLARKPPSEGGGSAAVPAKGRRRVPKVRSKETG